MSSTPQLIGAGGKKRSGKDTFCDSFVSERGFLKVHIADPWLMHWAKTNGIPWEEYVANKHIYRPRVQADALLARQENPNVLTDLLDEQLEHLFDKGVNGVAVTGIRFKNEARFIIARGGMMALIEVPDWIRRKRFVQSGESLELFNDPFEDDLDDLDFPCHLRVPGYFEPRVYPPLIEASYAHLVRIGRELVAEAA